jgi:hypothetical protein
MSSITEALPLSELHQNGSPDSQIQQSTLELRPITRQRQAIVLLSSFLTICITIGFNQSYGVFQNYYTSPGQTMLPKPTTNEGALIAFVGTLGSGLTWAGSILVNPLMERLDKEGVRWVGVVGVVCMSAGFGLASLSTEVSLARFPCPPCHFFRGQGPSKCGKHMAEKPMNRFWRLVLSNLDREERRML